MRSLNLVARKKFDKTIFQRFTYLCNALSWVYLIASLVFPKFFGFENRAYLIPFSIFLVSQWFSLYALVATKSSNTLRSLAFLIGLSALSIHFYFTNPIYHNWWLFWILPYCQQLLFTTNPRVLNSRLIMISLCAMLCFIFHFSKPQLVMALIEMSTIIFLVGCAVMMRNHERNLSRTLFATQNKLTEKQQHMVLTERFAAIGELSTGVAHEINNSLIVLGSGLEEMNDFFNQANQIPNLKQALENHQDYKIINKHLERMNRASLRIQRIVQQMRLFARDANQDQFQKIDLRSVLDDALFLVREQLETRNIQCQISVADFPVLVNAHASQLCQVVINLLNNARDVLETYNQKSIIIKVYAKASSAFIEVRDSGPGIPTEIQNKIFSPFNTSKSHEKGTGLGLSISFGIIKKHHGTLSYQTSKQGTTFIIELPLATMQVAA